MLSVEVMLLVGLTAMVDVSGKVAVGCTVDVMGTAGVNTAPSVSRIRSASAMARDQRVELVEKVLIIRKVSAPVRSTTMHPMSKR